MDRVVPDVAIISPSSSPGSGTEPKQSMEPHHPPPPSGRKVPRKLLLLAPSPTPYDARAASDRGVPDLRRAGGEGRVGCRQASIHRTQSAHTRLRTGKSHHFYPPSGDHSDAPPLPLTMARRRTIGSGHQERVEMVRLRTAVLPVRQQAVPVQAHANGGFWGTIRKQRVVFYT